MKSAICRLSGLVFIISVISVSCREAVVNEFKINDFGSLKKEFVNPSAEYSTAPFFVWNYKITKEEIGKFLTDFKEKGILQVFVHPRPGLITEYLSDEWFELFKYTVDKGKELGMKIWIYDENSYPSGFAGGHVPDQMPESYNQGQGLRMTKVELLPDTADKYFLCLREEADGKFTDITSTLPSEKGKAGKYFLFSKTYNGKSDWYGGFPYVDLLFEGVTEKFIEITMTGYEKYTGEEFGKTIPGTFTDEPQIRSSGGIRWTPDLFDVFTAKWGYDLRTQLPSLFEEVGDWKRVRHNYTQTLLQMFIDRWALPWYSYCEEKGLKFTGHYWEHEWPAMTACGDNMAMYAWHQMPAIDMLFNQWNDSTSRAQFGNVRSVKELASAANQSGRARKLSETYGGGGWELTFTDMKRLGDWEYALGVNQMNQHLTYFSMVGSRKSDYPPAFDYHEPWWDNYKYLSMHYARLSAALSAGLQKNDILVLEPTTSAWLYDSYVKKNPQYAVIGQAFQSFITKLEKNQAEYDLGSENIIKDMGSVKGGKLIVGSCGYSRVVLPPLMENLDLATFRLLKKFVAGGGTMIAFSKPMLTDGSPSDETVKFFNDNTDRIKFENELSAKVIEKYFSSDGLKFTRFKYGDLYHHRRMLSDGQLVFIVNSSLTEQASGSFTAEGEAAYELNTINGAIQGYMWSDEGDNIAVDFSLPPAGSLLLFIPYVYNERHITPYKPKYLNPLPPSSTMKITREKSNILAIPFCDLTLDGETTRDMHYYSATDKVFKAHGFVNGNPWNHAIQFRTSITDRDTFGINTGFTAEYHFTVKGDFDLSNIIAAVERPAIWEVYVNDTEVKAEGGEWIIDRETGVYRIGNLVRQGDNVIRLKASPMSVHAEIEPVYVAGDFSVRAAGKGWLIEPPVNNLTAGSWKEQGMPFYPWGVTYSLVYNIENPQEHYILRLGDWKGTVAVVTVNDTYKDVIAFPPYELNLTDQIRAGVNKITVTVIGSNKNLHGPHFNNPAPGQVAPGNFRNVKYYPAGKDYHLMDYGLMSEFQLLNGR
jgi:hypothetical protein